MATEQHSYQAHESVEHPPPTALQNSYGPEVSQYQYSSQIAPEVKHETVAPEVYHQQPLPAGYYKPYGEQPQQPVPDEASPKKRILGLPVALFWIVVGSIVLVVLGVSLGAGLGVGLSNRNSGSSSSTSTTSSSSSAVPTTGGQSSLSSFSSTTTVSSSTRSTSQRSSTASSTKTAVTSGSTGLAANSCTFTGARTYTSTTDGSTRFTEYCFTDWPAGDTPADGSSSTVKDLTRYIVYTFEACIEKCVAYNKALTSSSSTQCAAVTYNSNLTDIVPDQLGNCFLKDKKGTDRQGSAESACAAIVY